MPDFCGMKTNVGNSPADHADEGAEKDADRVHRNYTRSFLLQQQ